MTTPETVLGAALLATWAYRLGWHTGAVGMSRAMSGHPRGWARVVLWWKERGQTQESEAAEPQTSEFAERLKEAISAAQTEGRGTGQYL